MTDTTPKHTYETTEGTTPGPYTEHAARTVAHTTTTGETQTLHMMSEIGDGVFVQWSQCRTCNQRVDSCRCPGGPTEPEYITRWRGDRFARDLTKRPDPSFDILPSVLTWVRERGYTVTQTPDPITEAEATALAEADETEAPEVDSSEQVDAGLDAALEKVKAARNMDDIDPGF